MRFGISPFASTRAGAMRLARTALDGGIDTLWLGDGLLANPDFPGWAGSLEPFAELAWLAGALQPGRIGLSAAVLPIRDVVNVAKQASTLDVITEGSFVLVVAPGFWPNEFAFRNIPLAERGARFDDAVNALRALWRGDAHDGPFITVPGDGVVSPLPHTTGGPPLWLAGGRPTMERALRLGLAFQPSRALPDALAPLAHEWFDRGGGTLGVRIRVQATADVPPGASGRLECVGGPGSIPRRTAGPLCGVGCERHFCCAWSGRCHVTTHGGGAGWRGVAPTRRVTRGGYGPAPSSPAILPSASAARSTCSTGLSPRRASPTLTGAWVRARPRNQSVA